MSRSEVKNALSRTLYTFWSKWFIFLKFMSIKSTQWNNLRFFLKACTCVFNYINFRLQGLQIGAFQQRYLKCKCETPYFEGELVPKTCKNWKMSSKKNFLSGLVTKYPVYFQKISASTFWQQESQAARSLGLLMSRSEKLPGRSCPTPSDRDEMNWERKISLSLCPSSACSSYW